MEIHFNFTEDNSHVKNLAFVRALLIKCTIEKLDISYEEKEEIKRKVLEYLKNA